MYIGQSKLSTYNKEITALGLHMILIPEWTILPKTNLSYSAVCSKYEYLNNFAANQNGSLQSKLMIQGTVS